MSMIRGFAIAVRKAGDDKGQLVVLEMYAVDMEEMALGKVFLENEDSPDSECETIHVVTLFDPLYQLFERLGLDDTQNFTYNVVLPALEKLVDAVVRAAR